MARERYCKTCRGWHPPSDWPAECWQPKRVARGDFPLPLLNRDGMDPIQSMLDGQMYDSKSALRRTYKAAGVIEVGNDGPMASPPPRMGDAKAREAAAVSAMKRTGLWDELSD